jgi:SDR family mycofactocin-dependent oxidoreductase
MGLLEGKVAFITGAARGQGRAHAVRLAKEGADVIAVDICRNEATLAYALATSSDMAETVELVEQCGRRIIASQVDVRDEAALRDAFDGASSRLGPVSVVVANAGILAILGAQASRNRAWQESLNIMLTGVHNTIETAVPSMIRSGQGGAIVITSSTAGLKGLFASRAAATPGALGYVAAKHGVVGLMRAYASSLAPYGIRVNTIHPTGVNTPMVVNSAHDDFIAAHSDMWAGMRNALPVGLIEPTDLSDAVAFLCSDEARFVTGVTLPVDAGFSIR